MEVLECMKILWAVNDVLCQIDILEIDIEDIFHF